MNDLPNSQEPSSQEPSSEEPIEINKDANKIIWISNTSWYTWTSDLGYPRPQGNLPMINSLKSYKQKSLVNAYFNVGAGAYN